MIGELLQRAIDVDRRPLPPAAPGCLKDGSTTDPPALFSASTKAWSDAGSDGDAEIDVEDDVPHAGAVELPQQVGMQPARPGPDADLLDRGGIDRDNDDIAAGLPLLPGEPQIGQRIAQRAVPAGRQNDRQRNHHKNMRPVVFHNVPPRTPRRRGAPPMNVSRSG